MKTLVLLLWRLLTRILRRLGWGLLLVPVAAASIVAFGLNAWTVGAVALALLLAVWLPAIAAGLLAPAMIATGICGLVAAATAPRLAFNWPRILNVPLAKWVISRTPVPTPAAKTRAAQEALQRVTVQAKDHARTVWAPVKYVRPAPVPTYHVLRGKAAANALLHSLQAGIGQPKLPANLMVVGGQGDWHAQVPASTVARAAEPAVSGLLVPLSLLLLALGLLLLPRTLRRLRGLHGGIAGLTDYLRRRMQENYWGILLVPVTAMAIALFGVNPLTVAALVVAVAIAVERPKIAADLVPPALAALAGYGFAIAADWPLLAVPGAHAPGVLFGAVMVHTREAALLAGAEASAFLALGAWLVPRTIGTHARELLTGRPNAELASRVERLTETRTDALGAAAAELRRIERDLHDGAQARLVALGMNLRAAERLIPVSPEAAAALVAEARETSARALSDLRGLIRGICPPVLADRGLAEAVRALALDTPLPVCVEIDLPGRLDPPVESACYFAVAEALANAAKHAAARAVHVRVAYARRNLRIAVTDDGCGGADPARGTGLRGVERRLATFDGVLAVSSPPGGPTVIAMEVPCALSSPKTFSS
jgi:signal transduction histidine kinase